MSKQLSLVLETPGADWTVKETEIPKLEPGEVLIKVISSAINPMDWKIQKFKVGEPLVKSYPAILGIDSAGEVEEIGEGVAGFVKGDKVLHEGFIGSRTAAFQQYCVVKADFLAKVPSNISLDEAASIPLALATAAVGLYSPSKSIGAQLAWPWEESGKGAYRGKPILVMAGSTSCGQFAIQLARMSGFLPIITTASLHNTDLLKSLGATHVIDRKGDIAAEVAKISPGPFEVIYDAIAIADTQNVAWEILAPGGTLALVLHPVVNQEKYPNKRVFMTFGDASIEPNKELGKSLYSKLTQLLADGTLKPNRVEIIPNGLHGIVSALGRLERDEVSGLKLISKPQETKIL